MKCPRCQQDNSPHARFCLACGAPRNRVNENGLPEATHADLQREVQRLTRSLSEALEQQTATSEILHVISSSPTDLTPVFATIVANATRRSPSRSRCVGANDPIARVSPLRM